MEVAREAAAESPSKDQYGIKSQSYTVKVLEVEDQESLLSSSSSTANVSSLGNGRGGGGSRGGGRSRGGGGIRGGRGGRRQQDSFLPQRSSSRSGSDLTCDLMPKVPKFESVLDFRKFLFSLEWVEVGNFDYFISLINIAHNLAKGGKETYLCVDAFFHWADKNSVTYEGKSFYDKFSNSLKTGHLDKYYLTVVKDSFSRFESASNRIVNVTKFSQSTFSVEFVSAGVPKHVSIDFAMRVQYFDLCDMFPNMASNSLELAKQFWGSSPHLAPMATIQLPWQRDVSCFHNNANTPLIITLRIRGEVVMVNSMLLALHSPVFAELIAEGTKVVELDESLQREDGMVEGVRLAVMILHGQQVTLDQPQLELCYAFAEMYQLELLVNLCLKEFGAMIEEEADFYNTFERLIKTGAKWPEALFGQLFKVVGGNQTLVTQLKLNPDKLRECCRAAETRPVILGRLLWFLKDNSCLTRKHFTNMKFLAKFLNSKNTSSQPIVEFCMEVAREAVVDSPSKDQYCINSQTQHENQADLESRPSSASSSSKTRSFGSFHTEESSLPRSVGRGRGRHKSTSNSDNFITSPYNHYMGHKDDLYNQSFTSDQLGPQTHTYFNQGPQTDFSLIQGLQTHIEIINGPQTDIIGFNQGPSTDIDYVDWDELGISDSATTNIDTGPYTNGVTTVSSLAKLRLNDSISSSGSMPQIVPTQLVPLNSGDSILQNETGLVASPTHSDSMPKVPTLFSVLELRDFLVSLEWLEFGNFDYFILLINVAHNLAKGGKETYLCIDALLHWTKKNNVSFDTEGFYEQFSNSLKSGLLDKTYLSDVKQHFSTFDGKIDREVIVPRTTKKIHRTLRSGELALIGPNCGQRPHISGGRCWN
eukprot:sb/3461959/